MTKRLRQAAGLAALAALAAGTPACTGWHRAAKDVNVTGEDIVYLRDERTDLCFAVLYLQNKVGTSITDATMTAVPCESLGNVPAR